MRVSAGAADQGFLLGREQELAELEAALECARSGMGELVLVSGEAGIGKTRLVEALVQSVERTQVRAWWGRCWEGSGGRPFWPWMQVVRACVAETPVDALTRQLGAGAADVAQLAPELVDAIQGLVPTPSSGLPDARLRLYDAVGGFVHRAAAHGGLVLAFDDLHAGDEASLQLLEHVVDQALPDSHLLVVGTYRDTEVRASRRLHRRMSALVRHGRRISLSGLDQSAVEALLEVLGHDAPAAASRRVHEVTDGNPLYVHELSRLLDSGRATGIVSTDVPIPEGVYGVVRRRLDSVDSSTRELLTLAAVLGKDFELDLLAVLSGRSPAGALDVLYQRADLGIVVEVSLGRWRVVHGLLREALYEEIDPVDRPVLHGRAAEAIERTLGGEPGDHLAALAHHSYEAARGGRGTAAALRYCALAGDAAMAVLAFEEAAALYSRALEAMAMLRRVDERRHFELLTAAGDAQRRAGRFPQARETWRQALKVARVICSPEVLAQAAIGYAGPPESTFDEQRLSVIDEALVALPPGDTVVRALLLLAGATTTDYRAGRKRSRQALEVARRVGDPLTLREVLLQWHLLNQGFDLNDERLEAADELLALATEAGDRERMAVAHQWRGYDLFEAGDIPRARAEFERARADADELRLPFLRWGSTFPLAAIALLEGRIDDAEQLMDEAVAAGERSEFADVEGARIWQLSAIRRHQGRWAEMLRVARRAAEQRRHPWPGTNRLDLMVALAETGRVEEARSELAAVADTLLEGYPGWVAWAAEASWLTGDGRWASRIYDCLLPARGYHAVLGVACLSLGSYDRLLGQMASLLGRDDEAEAHFEAAHVLHRRMGAEAWLAAGQVDHARLLLRRGGADRRRAGQLLAEASDRYRALGMTEHAERLAEWTPRTAVPTDRLPASERASFVLEGGDRVLHYAGTSARLRDSKGMHYLARLLADPGHELHALDLAAGDAASPAETDAAGSAQAAGGSGSVLDPVAKAAYRDRLRALEEEIDGAEADGDPGASESARRAKDLLVAELAFALGLGGPDGDEAAARAERARQSATRALKGAVRRIADVHPVLGEHLRTTVRTGIYCVYVPDPRAPIRWETRPPPHTSR